MVKRADTAVAFEVGDQLLGRVLSPVQPTLRRRTRCVGAHRSRSVEHDLDVERIGSAHVRTCRHNRRRRCIWGYGQCRASDRQDAGGAEDEGQAWRCQPVRSHENYSSHLYGESWDYPPRR